MDGIVLGLALLVLPKLTLPAPEAPRSVTAPSRFGQYFVSDAMAALRPLPDPATNAGTVWRRELSPPRQSAPAKRFSKTERVIAVAAGVSLGWVVGGTIGGKLTESSNRDDDTSPLKGIMIGAPIGAVAGGMIGYRLRR